MAWIRLPGLPGYFYRRKILKDIGGMIGKETLNCWENYSGLVYFVGYFELFHAVNGYFKGSL